MGVVLGVIGVFAAISLLGFLIEHPIIIIGMLATGILIYLAHKHGLKKSAEEERRRKEEERRRGAEDLRRWVKEQRRNGKN
ncbi:MAG: hypothetical protein IKT60_06190 [Clostridia bacterium]|nr:hypothetical protein [Clostridia bacterium]